ncbi:alanine--tRNA ligase [Patescibacteria group bacterium]|nr:alanine--tRNA ligase [Patescibacteria group bacterium]
METRRIRQAYLEFFREKGHAIIPSASLLPENDPTVLFTTAGMHPLVPYLVGQPHPEGKRLTSSQKCLRTDDIEEVGDNRHLTFFEMLGNWSLGDYFKRESIAWSFEFLTKRIEIDPKRIYVTVFEGDAVAPRDTESIEIWQAQFEMQGIAAEEGIAEKDEPTKTNSGSRIYAYPKKKNWWGPAGQTGPCGPDTEIFYDTGFAHDKAFGEICHPNCDCGRFVEIWNNVFMEFDKQADGSFLPLAQKNVDTGMGLERMAAILQNKPTVFETDGFMPLIEAVEARSGQTYKAENVASVRPFRIIVEHMRAAVFIIGDRRGVVPSNVGQGYIVRRLLRRALREGRRLGIQGELLAPLADVVIETFSRDFAELHEHREKILSECAKEEEKFGKSLEKGMRELEKMSAKGALNGEQAFQLFSSYGFPLELTEEVLRERGQAVDREAFQAEFKKHQELSRNASAGVFKGGLADHSEESKRLHTATHLLQQALRQVLGTHVEQRGSNITAERLRFDFPHQQKLTDEELQRVESLVNDAINRDLPVSCEVMTAEEAKSRGAIGVFTDKYAELGGKIKVYTMGDFSKEVCGGPHVDHTGELKSFKIVKEEAVSAGIRRIKAVVG